MTRSAARSTAASAPNPSLTPAFVWRVYCQWWKWVLPLGIILSVAAGAIVWYFHVPWYAATAQLKIEADVPFIAFERTKFTNDLERFVQTQIETLRSPLVLDLVLKDEEIASNPEILQQVDPVKHLQEHLTVKQVGKSSYYNVSYESPSREFAKRVADTIVVEYLKKYAEANHAQVVIDKLDSMAERRDEELKKLRNEVVQLAKDTTGKDPFGTGAVMDVAAFSPTGSLYSRLIEAGFGLDVLNAELQALEEAPMITDDRASATGLLDLMISNRTDVRQLEQRIAYLGETAAHIKGKPRTKIGDTWENDPEYLRLQEQITSAKTELNELRATARDEIVQLREEERKGEQERRIAEKRQEIASLTKRRDSLNTEFNKHLSELKFSGELSAELALKKAQLEREERIYELIAARQLTLRTEQEAPARVSSVEEARVPPVPIEPIPYKLLLIACSLSLVAPLALAVVQESVVRRISSPEQLTAESLLPVLGEVARFPVRNVAANQRVLPTSQQRDLFIFAESIDSLRTNLMLTESLGAPGQRKIIAICSAASGEGKTSVAASLAMSISEATKQPTLVIDADLRAPDIADFMEVPNHPGVAEVLSGKASLGQAIHRVGDTQAYVMPAGKLRTNPHHILQGSKIDGLLAALREKFSTVVIDTPPVLSASESLVYARAADLVVFCSLADVSRAKQVRTAVDRLQSTGANIAGAVLSGVQVNRYIYNYGSYARSE